MRRFGHVLVAVAAVNMLLLVLVVLQGFPRASSPAVRLDAYLSAVAGAEPDRGWHLLGGSTRELSYGNDLAQYLRDAEAADWGAFSWSGAEVLWTHDGVALVQARLVSDAASVPAFLIQRQIVHGVCDAGPSAIGVFMDVRFLGDGGFSGGGLTGSQMGCNARFIGDTAFED